jgi:hypothetical protein
MSLLAGCGAGAHVGLATDAGERDIAAPDAAAGPDARSSMGDAPSRSDAPSRNDVARPDVPPDATAAAGIGEVVLTHLADRTSAMAAFELPPPLANGSCSCSESQVDNCTLLSCGSGPACGFGVAPPTTFFSAGDITISYPSGTPLILAPLPGDVIYPSVTIPGVLGAAGQRVDVVAAGADVPAFRASLVIPAPLQLTGDPAAVLVPGMPVVVRWKPSTEGDVEATAHYRFAPDMHWTDGTVTCTVPASAGTMTVPTPSFFSVQADTKLRIRRLTSTVVPAGGFKVTLQMVSSDTTLVPSSRDAGVSD